MRIEQGAIIIMKQIEKHICSPAFSNNIAIVLSSNNAFVPYMATMIQSIIDCSTEQNNYDIIILHSEITDYNTRKIISLANGLSNMSIRLFNVSDFCVGYDFFVGIGDSRLTKEAYYRLLIGDILSEEYTKAIYLDGDMITKKDIAELYELDLDGFYLAAVPDITGVAYCHKPGNDRLAYRKDKLKLNSTDTYFISSLLVINLKEFRNAYSSKQLLELAVSEGCNMIRMF